VVPQDVILACYCYEGYNNGMEGLPMS